MEVLFTELRMPFEQPLAGPKGARLKDEPNNQTADRGIFRACKINNLLIILE
jgi:hypothetical protein